MPSHHAEITGVRLSLLEISSVLVFILLNDNGLQESTCEAVMDSQTGGVLLR